MFKTRRVRVIKCEFTAGGSSEGILISEMSSKFACNLDFWVFKLSRVNSVCEFPELSLQLKVKSFENSWRTDFFLYCIINYGKNRDI